MKNTFYGINNGFHIAEKKILEHIAIETIQNKTEKYLKKINRVSVICGIKLSTCVSLTKDRESRVKNNFGKIMAKDFSNLMQTIILKI